MFPALEQAGSNALEREIAESKGCSDWADCMRDLSHVPVYSPEHCPAMHRHMAGVTSSFHWSVTNSRTTAGTLRGPVQSPAVEKYCPALERRRRLAACQLFVIDSFVKILGNTDTLSQTMRIIVLFGWISLISGLLGVFGALDQIFRNTKTELQTETVVVLISRISLI